MDKIIEDQIFTILKNRKIDTTKFKILNIMASNIYKLNYEEKFVTYIELSNYNLLNMNNSQTKLWNSYRTNLLNYAMSIIKNKDILDVICFVNIINNENIDVIEKCIDSLLKQSKKVYIVVLASNPNEIKIAIKKNVDFCFNTDKNPVQKILKGLAYIRGHIKGFKNIMICNSTDIFFPNWIDEGFKLLHKNKLEIVGKDSTFLFEKNKDNLYERIINKEVLEKLTNKIINDHLFLNGVIIKREFLLRIKWDLLDENTPNLTASFFKKNLIHTPKIGQINNSNFVSCFTDKTNKDLIHQYILHETNLINDLRELPYLTFDFQKEFDLNIKQKISTKISFNQEKKIKNNKKIISKNFGIEEEKTSSEENEKKNKLVPTIIKKKNNEIEIKTDLNLLNEIPKTKNVEVMEKKLPPQILKNIKQEKETKKAEIKVFPTNFIEEKEKSDEMILDNLDLNKPDSNLLKYFKNDFTIQSPRKILAIIPVLGRHEILKICIKCVKEQTIRTDLILLVSNKEDTNLAIELNLKYVFVENNPLSMKFQKGVDYAKILEANYIMFVGSDDLITKNWVEECVNCLENYSFDVVGKNFHYIYDSVNNVNYLRRYISDNLNNIPMGLKKNWCLGSGRLIKCNIMEKIEWKLFEKEINRGLDAESGLILYKKGARFGLISNENFVSIRDDWECITEMQTILESDSNKIIQIKSFNKELSELRDLYIRNKSIMIKNINIVPEEKIILKEIVSYTPNNILGKKILIYNGFVSNEDMKYNKPLFDKIVKQSPNFEFLYSNQIGKEKLMDDCNECSLMFLLKENKNIISDDIKIIYDFGMKGIPVISNYNLPNCIGYSNEEDIIKKLKIFANYSGNKFYHKLVTTKDFKSYDISEEIFKFAKNMKFSKKIKQLHVSSSLKNFESTIQEKFKFLGKYKDPNKATIFFGVYDKDIDKNTILNHQALGIAIWGGSDIYHKIVNDSEFIQQLKDKKNIVNLAISKDISDLLSSEKIKHIRNIFSFIKRNLFKPQPLGKKIYIYCNENNSTYNGPIVDYIKSKLTNYEFFDSRTFNVKYSIMPNLYANCFIGLRLTSFDGNANTSQELGLMGIKCIHNGDLPNCINWSLNDLDKIIEIIDEEAKNIGKTNNVLANQVSKYIEQDEKNYFIFHEDFYDFFMDFNVNFSVSVIINTFGNKDEDLKKIIQNMLSQKGLTNIQIILSTVEGDSSIDLYKNEFMNFSNIDLCICTKEEHPGKGAKGIYYQLNKATSFVKNAWVSYFSGNDIIYDNKFQLEIESCLKNNKLICYSSFNLKNKDKIKKEIFPSKYDYKKHLEGNYVSDCSLINTYIFKKLLPFNSEFENHAFWDLFLRAFEKYGDIFVYNNVPTWEYILSDDSAHIKRKNNPELQKENEKYRTLMLDSHKSFKC